MKTCILVFFALLALVYAAPQILIPKAGEEEANPPVIAPRSIDVFAPKRHGIGGGPIVPIVSAGANPEPEAPAKYEQREKKTITLGYDEAPKPYRYQYDNRRAKRDDETEARGLLIPNLKPKHLPALIINTTLKKNI